MTAEETAGSATVIIITIITLLLLLFPLTSLKVTAEETAGLARGSHAHRWQWTQAAMT